MKHFIRAALAIRVLLLLALFFLPLTIHSSADGSGSHRPATPEDALIHEIEQAQLRDQLGGVR